MMSDKLIELPNGWLLPLAGRAVTQCCVDFAFELVFWVSDDDIGFIQIGGKFELVTPDGTLKLDPASPADLGPAVALHQREVARAFTTKAGELELLFVDGAALRVAPDSSCEAWTATLKGGVRLVAMPGGRVAVWPGEDRE